MKQAEPQSKETSNSVSNSQGQGGQETRPISDAKRQRNKRRWEKYCLKKKQKKQARKLKQMQNKHKKNLMETTTTRTSYHQPQINPTKSIPNAAHDESSGFGDPMSIDDGSSLQKSTVGVAIQPVGTATINLDSTLRAIARNARLQIDIVDAAICNDAAAGDLARSNLKGYDGLSSATQTLQLRVEELSVLSDPVPGSRNLKDNENNNDLPKLYSSTMTIQNMEVDMPSIGGVSSLVTPLDFVPPPYPEADVEVADESDDENTESFAKKWLKSKQEYGVDKSSQCSIGWLITRPSDPRLKGSKDLKLRVNTVIPKLSHCFRYASRYKEEFEVAAKYRVKMVPQLSSRVYKDLINGIQAFSTVEQTPEQISSDVDAHLCEVLVTRARRTPFHGKKLKQDILEQITKTSLAT
ncbi:hypothetical protein BOTNAR_0070g00120 [Botryotinia narcissicola]|uniref:Uncharacterized protein n=1 Tax=Botryotinia narcissicola TaxID=278944 RepID=A0A4Z1IX98_9HELO|nr:hypothetical protein BOTNAR_0070g00120 [Botryotinia narcissicola]